MSKRDVELIIKARNQASGAVDAVSKSIEELKERQDVLGTSAAKAEGMLGELADELDKLKTVAGAVTAIDKLRESVDSAGDAYGRQAAELNRSRAAYDGLAKDAETAAKAAAPLREQVQQQSKAVDEQAKAVEKLRKTRAEAADQARKDAKAVASAEKRLAKLQQDIAAKSTKTREAKLPGAQESVTNTRAAAEKSAAAEKALTAAFEEQSAALATNRAAVAGAQRALKELEQTQATLASKMTTTGSTLAQQVGLLNQAEGEYTQLAGVLDRAQQQVVEFTTAQGVQGATAARAAVQIAVLRARMQELTNAQRTSKPPKLIDTESVRDAAAALRESGTVIANVSNQAEQSTDSLRELGQAVDTVARNVKKIDQAKATLAGQEAAADEARQAWAAAQDEVKRLAAAMRASAQPSEQLAAAFGRAQGRARAAKTAFLEQKGAADQMNASLRSASIGIDETGSSAGRLAHIVSSSNAALHQGRAALMDYSTGANNARSSSSSAAGGIRSVSPAAKQAASSLKQLLSMLFSVNQETRTSLSLGQRVRGQVLGITAAAGGVYAAQSAIASIVQASMDMEAVQSRFAVAFGDDQAKVARAMAFTKATAEELGLSYRVLSLQYSRLAAASLGTNLEGEKTEKIFYGLSEASRVLRLTDDELAGSFKAITDIMSKGAIQAEELKGQLGDRFPGAVQIMAKAVGVGTDELMKMMEAGKLTSDYLVGFADEISKRVNPAKAQAISSTAAEFDRLKNAVLEVQLAIAGSGFLEELTEGAVDLAKALKDPAVLEGFRRLGEALGNVTSDMAAMLPYAEEIIAAIKVLVGIMAFSVGKTLFSDALKGWGTASKGLDIIGDGLKKVGKNAKLAGGGVRGLMLALAPLGVTAGAVLAVGAALAYAGSEAWDWYKAQKALERQLRKIGGEHKAAHEELIAAEKELAAETAKREGVMVKSYDAPAKSAQEFGEKIADMTRGVVDGMMAGTNANRGYIRSQAELIEMSAGELAAYRKILEARQKVVDALEAAERAKPGDEQDLELLVRLNAEERALAEGVKQANIWYEARVSTMERTGKAVEGLGESMEQAMARADGLKARMEAVSQHHFDNVVLSLEKVRDARVAALTLSGADESKILQANSSFEEQKLAVIRQYSQRQREIIQQDEERRKQILSGQTLEADKRAQELLKIEQTASQARVQVAQQEVQAVAGAREAALGRYMAALQKVADLDRRIADIRMNGEFQVADIRRSAMGDLQAYRSREAELAQLNGRIQQEIAKGNLEVAESLAQRQLSLAQALNTEVKEGEKVVVSKEKAASKAVAGTQAANENLIAVLQKRRDIANKEAAEQKALYTSLTTALEKLNTLLARASGATTIDIPLTIDEQKAEDEIRRVESSIRGSFMNNKIGVPVTADTRDYVQTFTSDVLSTDGHVVKVGVFLEDGAYKLKANEIRGDKITAVASVEFSGSDLEKAIERAKEIVAGDFPRMQIALDSAATYAQFQDLTAEVRRQLSESSFVVTSQFEANTTEIDRLISKYSTDRTQAPVDFDPDTTAADRARAAIAKPIVVPITYQPSGDIPKRAKGGIIKVPGFSTGGSPGGYIRGPGTTTSDSILAAVSNKEYIVKAMAVKKYGLPFMEAVNSGRLDMDRLKGAGGASTSGGNGDSMTVDLTINGRQIGGLAGSRSSVLGLVDALHEIARQTGG